MTGGRSIPDDPLEFIQSCVRDRRVFWTYHVNMRLSGRFIRRDVLLAAAEHYELLESYPDDKYLPSYLVLASHEGEVFHVLFATDVDGNNVRMVTAYRPDPRDWETDFRRRRRP